MPTLPELTETMDDTFLSTWYSIKPEAIDNILNATPIWSVLMNAGCFQEQVGEKYITETIRYGRASAQAVRKGDTFNTEEPQLETMALWHWKYLGANVQRSLFDDQKNQGPYKIKDYVGTRLTAARDELEQSYEEDLWGTFVSSETANREIQSLNDMVPLVANRSTGTYGGITRPATYSTTDGIDSPATGNTFWGPKYLQGTLASIDTDLLGDMRNLYNAIHNNQSAPNLIITTKAIFEIYEDEAVDMSQIIKDETTRLADLGFEVLRFKGKPFIWCSGITTANMLFLNTDFIKFKYDPNMWFDMTAFKPTALGTDRAAQILCAGNLISNQLRRHGRAVWA